MVLLLTCIANIKKILWQRNLLGPKTAVSTSVFDIFGANLKKTGWYTCAVGILVPALWEREILRNLCRWSWNASVLLDVLYILTNISTKRAVLEYGLETKKSVNDKELPECFLASGKFTCLGAWHFMAWRVNWFDIWLTMKTNIRSRYRIRLLFLELVSTFLVYSLIYSQWHKRQLSRRLSLCTFMGSQAYISLLFLTLP